MRRRTFTKEFNQDAVRLSHESDSSVAQVAQNLGVRPELLYRWRTEAHRQEEMRQLHRQLEQVRMERDIQKKH